jgi:acetyl-CoA carboxylase, biotin carboxylase subunit
VQRRHQKLLEESPAPLLPARTRDGLRQAALTVAAAVNYVSAGTVEFLVDEDGNFYFIEMNTRIQVEHPVTELVTGIDIVREQLRIAAGERLTTTGRAHRSGHAIEIRINAEDPERNFIPSPGRIDRLRAPGGPGVRLDTHVDSGSTIPPMYDSLIAKLCVWDTDRAAAIERGLRALDEFEVEGISTTRDFARDVLRSEAFRSGEYTTSYVEESGR